jgi:hypothetical protein
VALPTSDEEWVSHLSLGLDFERPRLRAYSDEYELIAPRAYMHPEVMREVGERLQQVVIAWPQLVVDALEERLDVEGFRLPTEDEADKDLWRVWQENNCDEQSQMGHIDALVMGRSYIAVGTNEDDADTPLITFESPLEVYAEVDPRTRKVRAALRRWTESEASLVRTQEQYATLYLPDHTAFYELTGGKWNEYDRDEHGLGEVPLVPLVNRARLANWRGRSELAPILPLAHAANKIATDMMVAAEFVAIPLRGMFGVGPSDFEDEHGNKLTALQAIMGRMLTIPDDEGHARQFEFAASQLSNFHSTLDALARLVASLSGLPPHFLGLTTDNPASADAIRSSETRLIKRAERRQRPFGGSHEQTMRLVRRFQEGSWDPSLRLLEAIWRDASTPTVAQSADAAVKLFTTTPKPIVPLRQTRERLGFSPQAIDRMEAEDAKAAAADPLGQLSQAMGQWGGAPDPALEDGADAGADGAPADSSGLDSQIQSELDNLA